MRRKAAQHKQEEPAGRTNKMAATTLDVAALAGVSSATVSRVFTAANRVTEKTRQRVLQAAEQLRFSPNVLAAGLRSGSSKLIALVTNHTPEMLDAAHIHAEKAGYSLLAHLLTYRERHEADESLSIARLLRYRPAGVIWLPSTNSRFRDCVGSWPPGIPVVFLEHAFNVPETVGLVQLSAERSVCLASDHLQQQGYASLIYVDHDRVSPGAEARCRLWRADPRRRHVCLTVGQDGQCETDALREELRHVSPPIGIWCASDHLAIHVLRLAESMGLRVPEQVGVMGFGDLLLGSQWRMGELLAKPFTSIRTFDGLQVRLALERLIDVAERRSTEAFTTRTVDPELIVRDSTRRIPEGER